MIGDLDLFGSYRQVMCLSWDKESKRGKVKRGAGAEASFQPFAGDGHSPLPNNLGVAPITAHPALEEQTSDRKHPHAVEAPRADRTISSAMCSTSC